jgi:hypothetical protein
MSDGDSSDDFWKDHQPETLPWQNFEEEVAQYLERNCHQLGVDGTGTRVRRKPRYYSKARESDIQFDASLEIYSSLKPERPCIIWLWECKDYPNHKVGVEEVEEFHHKLLQVGAHKGTIVTRLGFQEGAMTLAKTHGIGLMTLIKEKAWAFGMSQDAGFLSHERIYATYSLYTFGREVEGPDLNTIIDYELSKWEPE